MTNTTPTGPKADDLLSHRHNVPAQVTINANRGDLEDLENLLLWSKEQQAEHLWSIVRAWLGKSTD